MRRWFSAPAGPSSCSGSSSSRRSFLLRPLGRAWGDEEQPGPPAAPEAGRASGRPSDALGGVVALPTPCIQTSGRQNSGDSCVCCLKPAHFGTRPWQEGAEVAQGQSRGARRRSRGRRRGRAGRGGVEGQNEPRGRATAVPRARRAAREEPGALDLSKVSERLIRKSIVINQVRDGSEEQHPGAQRS